MKGSLGEAERGRQKGRREAKVGQAPRWVPTQGSGKRAPRKCRVGVSWSSRTERGRGKSNAAGRPKAAGGGRAASTGRVRAPGGTGRVAKVWGWHRVCDR